MVDVEKSLKMILLQPKLSGKYTTSHEAYLLEKLAYYYPGIPLPTVIISDLILVQSKWNRQNQIQIQPKGIYSNSTFKQSYSP